MKKVSSPKKSASRVKGTASPKPAARTPKSKAPASHSALRTPSKASSPQSASRTPQSYNRLLEDLRIHQVELEAQNEELRSAQHALEISRSRYAALFDLSPLAYFAFDVRGKILELNLRASELLGISRVLLVSRSFLSFVAPSHRDLFRMHMADVLSSVGNRTSEIEIIRRDKSQFIAHLESVARRGLDPSSVQCFTALMDVTTLRQTERKLLIKDAAIASSTNGIALADLGGRITYINDSLLAMLGYDRPKDVLGRRALEFAHSPAEAETALRELLSQGFWRGELDGVRKNGSAFPLEISASIVRDSNGVPICLMGSFVDITERKQAEDSMRLLTENIAQRNLELEALNNELEAFNQSISHDLRAPLRSMAGFSAALSEEYAEKLDEKGKDYLDRIRRGAEKMTARLESLLNLSRISRQEIERMDTDLSRLAVSAANNLRAVFPDRDVTIVIQENLRASVDPNLFRIVLTDLFDNAWKFSSGTEHARIEFGATESEARNGKRETVYYVKDNGAGFDQQYAYKIFWPFHSLHSEREFPGTGIGLATVDRIVRRHGGRVWAEGEVGKGATVYISLG